MKKIRYHKLVRDKIPDVIKKNGGAFKIRKLSRAAFARELMKKAHEETSAFPKLKTKREIASEMADVLAVFDEIRVIKRMSKRDIDQALKANMRKKGGFRKRLFLLWAEDTGYRTNETRSRR